MKRLTDDQVAWYAGTSRTAKWTADMAVHENIVTLAREVQAHRSSCECAPTALPIGYLVVVENYNGSDVLSWIDISPAVIFAIEDDDDALVIDSDLDRQSPGEKKTVTLHPTPAAAARYLRRLRRIAAEEGDQELAVLYEGAVLRLNDFDEDFDR